MLNEYKQLHKITIFAPQEPVLMSWQEKYRALRSIKFVKEKLYGKIKGRTRADGGPKQRYTPHE